MSVLDDKPPWDQIPYYAAPVETVVAATVTATVAAKGDPLRRFLIAALQPGATGTTFLTLTSLNNGVSGIPLNVTFSPLILSWYDIGPAITYPWFLSVAGPGGGNVTIITQSLIRWPGDGPPPLTEQIDETVKRSSGRPTNGHDTVNGQRQRSGMQSTQAALDDLTTLIKSCQPGIQWSRGSNGWIPPRGWGRPFHS